MILALGGALSGKLAMLATERGQLEFLEVMLEEDLRCIRHAAASGISTL
ncbi:MAG: hypothetical protein AAGI03_13325 [Pseudomonadota bacterium]